MVPATMQSAKVNSTFFHGYEGDLLPFIVHSSLAQTWQARVGFRDTVTRIFTNQEHMPM